MGTSQQRQCGWIGLALTPTSKDEYVENCYDLVEDMAAEQKARAIYEHLIDLASDEDVIQPLLFLRQREVVHFNRFKELRDYYLEKYKNNI